MKKIFTLVLLLTGLVSFSNAQQFLAGWNFPTGTAADSLADAGLTVNLDKAITTLGGTGAIDFSKNGATTKSAQATGWDNGEMQKAWAVHISTSGYNNLKLSSKMQSGGNNPGPRDYKVQYRIGASGDWTDVPGSQITTANDWSTGVLDSIAIPDACSDKEAVWFRWVMTSNTSSTGTTVGPNGINKIDDIYITGTELPTGIETPEQNTLVFNVYPNPSAGNVFISSAGKISTVRIYSMAGEEVLNESVDSGTFTLMQGTLNTGIYLLQLVTDDQATGVRKLVIMQ